MLPSAICNYYHLSREVLKYAVLYIAYYSTVARTVDQLKDLLHIVCALINY
jgi:hypothetical protein